MRVERVTLFPPMFGHPGISERQVLLSAREQSTLRSAARIAAKVREIRQDAGAPEGTGTDVDLGMLDLLAVQLADDGGSVLL